MGVSELPPGFAPPPALKYAGGTIDRAATARRNPSWVDEQRRHPAARVIPLRHDQLLIDESASGGPRPGLREVASITDVAPDALFVLLGLDSRGAPIFAADLGDVSADRLAALAAEGRFVPLRQIGPALDHEHAALLGYAHGLIVWHRRAGYCGECGAPTAIAEGGFVRNCTSADCGGHVYPRTDPAVIMLVEHPASAEHPARCLLARHPRLPAGMYSTLAGFVEPGESLEEAVVREVREETAVEVDAVRYVASQPWPFPASLMIGFRARAVSEEIRIDTEELGEARWFTAAEVAAFGDPSDEHAAFRLPRRDSIARSLVDGWVAEQLGER